MAVGAPFGGWITWWGGFPRCVMVRRCSSLSTSFVLAALRALHVDSSCVRGAEDQDRGKPPVGGAQLQRDRS
jgi:hypothetical protein